MTALTLITSIGITDSLYDNSNSVARAEENSEAKAKIEAVKNSFHAPYNIVTKIEGPDFSATGFVSGKTTVMTNKHVLKSILKEGTLKTDVILAKNNANEGTKKDLGTFKIKDYTEAPGDIDVVILEMQPNEKGQYIGDVVKPATIKNADDINQDWIDKNKDKKFYTAGYPGGRDLDTMWESEGGLLFFIGRTDPIKFFGSMPGAPGSSGSPVFNDRHEVVGIVYSGWEAGQGVNGYLFREDLYKFIEANA
nr:trypsin-like peptidase domain-containing protein [Staphylococcus agnetis]